MFICRVCRFETELDDVLMKLSAGRCICLRCFEHETGTARSMPPALRREITAAMAA